MSDKCRGIKCFYRKQACCLPAKADSACSERRQGALRIRFALFSALMALAVCRTGLATEYLFKGGWYDGYDRSTYWFPDSGPLQYALIRYTGGWYDGYTRCMVTNLTISIRGTIIIIR